MKTKIVIIISILFSTLLTGQQLNGEVLLDDGRKILLGTIDRNGLLMPGYREWFAINYETYTPNEETISKFGEMLAEYKIKIFLGTWCGDSKRQVPRMLKILDSVKFPKEGLRMIALDVRKDRYKKSPNEEEWGLQILRVPTVIFYRNGREVNRIIESPNTTLEEDMLAIIKRDVYVPNKAKSMHFD